MFCVCTSQLFLRIIEDGKIVAVRPPDTDDSDVDIAGAVADSVEVSMKKEDGMDASK